MVERLKNKLAYQERAAKEGYFGSSTPSSKIPIKANALGENQARKGGGKPGHKGHGRKALKEEDADMVEEIKVDVCKCPDCGAKLESRGGRKRTVVDCEPVKARRVVYKLATKKCPECGLVIEAKAPGVLPKSLCSNRFLTYVATEHYLRGISPGRLEDQLKTGYGSLTGAMRRPAKIFSPVSGELIKQYRQADVKHADETGWRNDGKNGYARLFAAKKISVYRFGKSRSAAVAGDVFGAEKLPGVLVVDRYNAYNKTPCKIQCCYARLLREVENPEKEHPDNREIMAFAGRVIPLLSEAMGLRIYGFGKKVFKKHASKIKRKIVKAMNNEAGHPGIQRIQDIFRRNAKRLYHWARDGDIPAENNSAERELRSPVIARKLSFGSQSDAGAKTREILMTVLMTIAKQSDDHFGVFRNTLDLLSKNPGLDVFQSLFAGKRQNFKKHPDN